MELYTHRKNGRFVWLNGYKVVGDDGHHMLINREMLQAGGSTINHSKAMSFTRDEPKFRQTCVACAGGAIRHQGTVEKHFSVDQIIL
jgi:hypothetical protein